MPSYTNVFANRFINEKRNNKNCPLPFYKRINRYLHELNIQIPNVLERKTYKYPPWIIKILTINNLKDSTPNPNCRKIYITSIKEHENINIYLKDSNKIYKLQLTKNVVNKTNSNSIAIRSALRLVLNIRYTKTYLIMENNHCINKIYNKYTSNSIIREIHELLHQIVSNEHTVEILICNNILSSLEEMTLAPHLIQDIVNPAYEI